MQPEFDPVPYVPTVYKNAEQFAYKISGNSMDRKGILPGDYVICVPYSVARSSPQHGDVVVIEQYDCKKVETSCRVVAASGDSFDLCPASTDQRFTTVTVPIWADMTSTDSTHVEVLGLVIGKYTPF
jgi:SOS-response transcriptional repressor LexA